MFGPGISLVGLDFAGEFGRLYFAVGGPKEGHLQAGAE